MLAFSVRKDQIHNTVALEYTNLIAQDVYI